MAESGFKPEDAPFSGRILKDRTQAIGRKGNAPDTAVAFLPLTGINIRYDQVRDISGALDGDLINLVTAGVDKKAVAGFFQGNGPRSPGHGDLALFK